MDEFNILMQLGGGSAVGMSVIVYLLRQIRIVRADMSKSAAELHKRIEDVKDNFVRRDDLATHIAHIERMVETIHNELHAHNKQVNQRMDTLLASFTNERKVGR